MAKIAIMGYGNIGDGVVKTLEMNKKLITARAGEEIEVKYVLDLRDFPGDPIQDKIVHDYKVIAEDPEVSVVVETMGGVEPANTFVMAMLQAGKSVATSNKALVEANGAALMETANAHGCSFMFEASVGGGIPIIRPLNNCMVADKITEICGILNGTTNFILTQMQENGADFEPTLKRAQELGYAEKDPTADISGGDTCRKLAILSSIITEKTMHFEDIHMEGITEISATDVKFAKAINSSIKLLARSVIREDGQVEAIVAPYLVPTGHSLYNVNDVFNGILVQGNVVDSLMFYGRGAGKFPTASAVVADVISEVRLKGGSLTKPWKQEIVKPVEFEDMENTFLVRLQADADPLDYEPALVPETILDGVVPGEIAIITHPMTEGELECAMKKVRGVKGRIRVYR